MTLFDKNFELISVQEEPDMCDGPWASYVIRGSNGFDVTGVMAGTVEQVTEKLRKQVYHANKRRQLQQPWVQWSWNPSPAF